MANEIKRIGVGARMSEAVAYNGIVWLAGQVGNPGDSVADQASASATASSGQQSSAATRMAPV